MIHHISLRNTAAAAIVLAALVLPASAGAQAMYFDSARMADTTTTTNAQPVPTSVMALPVRGAAQADTTDIVWPLLTDFDNVDTYMLATALYPYKKLVASRPLPSTAFMPSVFTGYTFSENRDVFTSDFSGEPALRWLEEEAAGARALERMQRYLFYQHPEKVVYDINLLPEAPKRYHAVVNPQDHTIEIKELATPDKVEATVEAEVKQRHWIRAFSASLQFSQAYVSPNWYQGGNSNINGLANIYYNVKLNQAFHPNLLFESTMQYKLGINNAPEDKVHSYNISDDLLQLTSTFGVKAARRWYYSVSGMFKTQLLNSYKPNSNDVQSAFLSPGELNLGVGMTYNFTNTKKTISFDASISPPSHNLKTCTYWRVDPTAYEIAEGRKCRHKFGSSAELKFQWKISYNITYSTRMFAFTDYSDAYADWENTIVFDINRFLTTQIYAHLRYDSATQPCDDPQWHKLQIKEILSIGFAYKFNSI